MSSVLKGNDVNEDSHVDIGDLKAAFTKAGVREECLEFAQASLEHLMHHHDHDDNGALHHDECDKWRPKT